MPEICHTKRVLVRTRVPWYCLSVESFFVFRNKSRTGCFRWTPLGLVCFVFVRGRSSRSGSWSRSSTSAVKTETTGRRLRCSRGKVATMAWREVRGRGLLPEARGCVGRDLPAEPFFLCWNLATVRHTPPPDTPFSLSPPPAATARLAAMKVTTSLRKMCKHCQKVKRKGKSYVICKAVRFVCLLRAIACVLRPHIVNLAHTQPRACSGVLAVAWLCGVAPSAVSPRLPCCVQWVNGAPRAPHVHRIPRCAQNSRHKQRQRFSVDAAQYRAAGGAADTMATVEAGASGSATPIRFFTAMPAGAAACPSAAAAAPVTPPMAARGGRMSIAMAAMLVPILC